MGDGGITQSVRALAKGLEAIGYQVTVIFDKGPEEAPEPNWRGVAHRGAGVFRFPGGLESALAGVDVVVFHSAWVMHNVSAAKVVSKLGIPYVLAPRGAYDPLIMLRRKWIKRIWWRLFERRLVEGAAAVHVFFDSQKSHLEALGFNGPFVVAPNGVSVPEDFKWDGITKNQLAYVGRYDPEHKGLDLLVEAMSLIPESTRPKLVMRGPDWRGGKDRIEAQVARMGLEQWVEVGPAIYGSDKWELICTSAGFVYPSRWEAFGNSPAEAAALGAPTLVTGYPLGRFLDDHGAAVVAETSAEGIADGLVRLLAPEAAAIGAAGTEVMRRFTWEALSESWGTQLDGIVRKVREPQPLP